MFWKVCSKINGIVSHFPPNLYWGEKSSKGNSINDIFDKADLVAVGHMHPRSPQYSRRDKTLTTTCPPLKSVNKDVLGVIDNGQISQHEIDFDKDSFVVVSFPLSITQITSNSYFDSSNLNVRVLQFSETSSTMNVKIDGLSIGILASTTISDAVFLWSKTITIGQRSHSLDASDGIASTHAIFFFS